MSRGTGAEVVQEGTSCGSGGVSGGSGGSGGLAGSGSSQENRFVDFGTSNFEVEPFTFRLEPVVAILEERFLTGDIDLSGAQPDEKHSLLSCRRS